MHRASIENENIIGTPSIAMMFGFCVMAFTKPKDNILIMTPVYDFYHKSATTLDRNILAT